MYIILFLIAFLVSSVNASEKISMAVYDFEASQVVQTLADSVADFVQSGLYDAGRFNIIERKNVQKILKEQQFQKTGCTTTECAVEVGRLLNVSNIVTGRVSRTGKTIVISMQLIDVEAGKVILTDKVETDSEDLLNTASTELAKHFSKGVSIKGKVLKILNENEIIMNLGIVDNIEKDQRLTIERITESVKDDTGKIVYQIKKKIATVIPDEIMEEASKVKVISKEDIIKEGDLIEIKRERLKPLDPILKRGVVNSETTPLLVSRTTAPNEEMGYCGFSASREETSDFFVKTKDTNGVLVYDGKIGTIAPHWSYWMSVGGPVISKNDLKWLLDLECIFGLKLIRLYTLNGVEWQDYIFLLMPVGLGLKFYPFTPLLNPDYLQFKTASEQRGWFAPYITICGDIYMGLFDANTKDYYEESQFLFSVGAEAKAGIEIANVLFVEFIYRFLTTISDKWTWYNTNGYKIGTSDYNFNLNTTGFVFGLKIPF
ncbi:MAG: CsgG/HfaB family protein [Candidatus Firestonebacteria bacterium]